MARDRVLVNGDYVRTAAGSWETTTTAATKCYHQLRTAFNTWPGDAKAGAEYALLERKQTEDELARLVDMTRRALQPLLDEGVIRDLKIEIADDQVGRRVLVTEAIDVQSGETLDLSPFVSYGA